MSIGYCDECGLYCDHEATCKIRLKGSKSALAPSYAGKATRQRPLTDIEEGQRTMLTKRQEGRTPPRDSPDSDLMPHCEEA